MYEVDFTGWVRTPEELQKLKKNWKYRWFMNWRRYFLGLKYRRFGQLWSLFIWALINQKKYW